MQQTQDKAMEPLNKALQESVEKLGKSGNYTMIVDARAGLLYFDKSIDLSDTITKQLNATLK
jgi:Skp family chaperone for outer membrane proteins